MQKVKNCIINIADVITIPVVFIVAIYLKRVRGIGIKNFNMTSKILKYIGVFPIRDHYYEPMFKFENLKYPLQKDRTLPGIDFNINKQLEILNSFHYEKELEKISIENKGDGKFYYDNGNYCSGDAEYLYSMIRFFKSARIIEIGSGYSTLMTIEALEKNKKEDGAYECYHQCIEPYEMPWLEKTSAKIIREKVEDVDLEMFKSLGENDILFIDSSHMIRPQGDVLYEYLQLLPILNSGVIIHFHDIFTPKDYPDTWVKDDVRFWNEQYILEAFLSNNGDFEIIGALNFLMHNHYDLFSNKCPILKKQVGREPGGFWIRKL